MESKKLIIIKDTDIMRKTTNCTTSGKISKAWDIVIKNKDNTIEHIYINAENGNVMGGNK